jgi:hypothetical protein
MHTIVIDEDSDLTIVAKAVLNFPRKVCPQGIMCIAGQENPDYAATWETLPSMPGNTTSVIAPGYVKSQLPEILETMTTGAIVSQERLQLRQKMEELEEKILNSPLLAGGRRIKVSSLKKSCYERISKSYTRAEIDRAIKNLIIKKSLINEVGKEGRGKKAREYQFVRKQ